MITLHFGRYNGRKDVVKKLEILTAKNELYVIPRTPFDPLNPTFTLTFPTPIEHALYNYGWFEYHTKKYCGWLNWVAIQDTTYTVNMYIDPVVTAYENGCFEGVSAKMLYSDNGQNLNTDPRITYDQCPVRESALVYEGNLATGLYALVIQTPLVNPFNSSSPACNGDNKAVYITNRDGLDWFFQEVLDNDGVLDLTEKKMYLGSILCVYHLRGVDATMIFNHPMAKSIFLTAVTQPPLLLDIGIYGKEIPIPSRLIFYKYDRPITAKRQYEFIYAPDPRDFSSEIALNIDELTEFKFTLNDVGGGRANIRNIDSIGYRIYVDPLGGCYIFTMIINGTDILGVTNVVPINEKMVFTNADAQDNLSQYGDALISLGQGVSSSGLVGGIVSLAGAGVGMAVSAYNGASGTNVLTGVGGSVSGQLRHGLYVHYYRHIDRTGKINFQKLYGKVDGTLRILTTITSGYFQTENVMLKTNNLPVAIIQQAEAQLNAGVRMT